MKTKVYVLICFLLLLLGFVLGALLFQGRAPQARVVYVVSPEVKSEREELKLALQQAYWIMTKSEAALGLRKNTLVSYYGYEFAGRPTTSGEIYDPTAMTFAHKYYPFGTWVEFYYPKTGRKVLARCNDRGPFVTGREADLSLAAAVKIGLIDAGFDVMETRVVGY